MEEANKDQCKLLINMLCQFSRASSNTGACRAGGAGCDTLQSNRGDPRQLSLDDAGPDGTFRTLQFSSWVGAPDRPS